LCGGKPPCQGVSPCHTIEEEWNLLITDIECDHSSSRNKWNQIPCICRPQGRQFVGVLPSPQILGSGNLLIPPYISTTRRTISRRYFRIYRSPHNLERKTIGRRGFFWSFLVMQRKRSKTN